MTRRQILFSFLTAVLAVIAVWSAAVCAGTFRRETAAPMSYDGAKAAFVLRDYEGYVSVFSPASPDDPLQITAIRTGQLRRADQKLLQGGLTVGSREQLLLLLEDLGD